MTRHIAVDEFYRNPAKYVDEVGDDPLYIGDSAVMVSRDEFEGLVETADERLRFDLYRVMA